MAFLEPFFILELGDGFEDGLGADTVSPVRVCKVACHIDLVRPDFPEKVNDDVYVFLGPFPFLDSSDLVERQVEEMCVGVRVQPERPYGCPGLRTADGPLDVQKFTWLRLAARDG